MNKEEFRARGLQARNALDLEDQTENSFQIMKKLLKLDDFVLAETIAFFVGIKTEVLTEPMIQEALLGGKTVLVPVSDMKSRTMFFAQIESLEELEETEHGLYEPLNGTEFPLEEIDIIVVPMSAFDLQGNRGCRGLMPENSIPGMLKALEIGVNTLEMDVMISKDKQVFLSYERVRQPFTF